MRSPRTRTRAMRDDAPPCCDPHRTRSGLAGHAPRWCEARGVASWQRLLRVSSRQSAGCAARERLSQGAGTPDSQTQRRVSLLRTLSRCFRSPFSRVSSLRLVGRSAPKKSLARCSAWELASGHSARVLLLCECQGECEADGSARMACRTGIVRRSAAGVSRGWSSRSGDEVPSPRADGTDADAINAAQTTKRFQQMHLSEATATIHPPTRVYQAIARLAGPRAWRNVTTAAGSAIRKARHSPSRMLTWRHHPCVVCVDLWSTRLAASSSPSCPPFPPALLVSLFRLIDVAAMSMMDSQSVGQHGERAHSRVMVLLRGIAPACILLLAKLVCTSPLRDCGCELTNITLASRCAS